MWPFLEKSILLLNKYKITTLTKKYMINVSYHFLQLDISLICLTGIPNQCWVSYFLLYNSLQLRSVFEKVTR